MSFVTCLFVSGGWQAVVHRSEWVDPCELCPVVCWGVWGWWRLAEECSHGCSQGKTAGKTLCPTLFLLYFQCIFVVQIITTCCTVYSALWEVSKARGHSWLLPHLLHQQLPLHVRPPVPLRLSGGQESLLSKAQGPHQRRGEKIVLFTI